MRDAPAAGPHLTYRLELAGKLFRDDWFRATAGADGASVVVTCAWSAYFSLRLMVARTELHGMETIPRPIRDEDRMAAAALADELEGFDVAWRAAGSPVERFVPIVHSARDQRTSAPWRIEQDFDMPCIGALVRGLRDPDRWTIPDVADWDAKDETSPAHVLCDLHMVNENGIFEDFFGWSNDGAVVSVASDLANEDWGVEVHRDAVRLERAVRLVLCDTRAGGEREEQFIRNDD